LDWTKVCPPTQKLDATDRAEPTVRFPIVETFEKNVAEPPTVRVLRRAVCFATPNAPRVETSVLNVA
jgi:hypothetical protein